MVFSRIITYADMKNSIKFLFIFSATTTDGASVVTIIIIVLVIAAVFAITLGAICYARRKLLYGRKKEFPIPMQPNVSEHVHDVATLTLSLGGEHLISPLNNK